MEIFTSILSLFAGIGVFIVGMNMLSSSLQKIAGPGMKKLIGKITSNRFAGVGIGASVTALIQSSAATTVMAIGFVNIGAMTLSQATSVVMGAKIGTTVTGFLVSLQSFDVGSYIAVLALVGVMMQFLKNDRVRNIGGILCGLGLIFIGLDLMSSSFNNDSVKESIQNIFNNISFPLLLLLLGIIFTAIMQSSSAMTGLVIIMVSSGALTLGDGLFIILGANFGTCITPLIATIGSNTNAKRTGFIYAFISFVGVFIFTILTWALKDQVVIALGLINNNSYAIAIYNLILNVINTVILLPLIKYIVKLSEIVIKDKKDKQQEELKFIDDRLLRTPAIAMYQTKKEIISMASKARENLEKSITDILTESSDNKKEIFDTEEVINYMNKAITQYLIKLTPLLDSKDEKQAGGYFHVINDIERIGDFAKNFYDDAYNMKVEGYSFSTIAKGELKEMSDTLFKMYDIALNLFTKGKKSKTMLKELSDLEEKIDDYKKEFSANHFERLSNDDCSIELGTYYTEIINSLERIGDHIVNIGFSVKNPIGAQH